MHSGKRAQRHLPTVDGQRLTIRLLGPSSITFDGEPLRWKAPPHTLALLALLALNRDAAATRASLAASLWPDELDLDARANLRRHLHHLQRALPKIHGVSWVLADARSLAWNPQAPGWIDVRAFEEAAADPERAADAVAYYAGDLLPGVDAESIVAARERLRDVYVGLLGRLTRNAREAGDFGAAIAYADALLEQDEWMEEAVRDRVAAIYESGDRSGALAAFERFAERLRSAFAAEPTRESIALRDLVRAGLPLPANPESAFARPQGDAAQRMWNLPFVGRAETFDRLRSAWSRAARGRGSIAFVSGEAGIGKSRLALELLALVRSQGGIGLVGTTANPEGEPYETFVGALRPTVSLIARGDDADRPWLAALAQILPEIASIRPDLPASEALPEGRARERLIEAFARAIERLCSARPVCLVLEDVHWAGAASIDLLAALARRAGALPLMIVATYRSEESTGAHPIRALRTALVAERRATPLPLDRLTPAEVAEVVDSIGGDEGPPPACLGDTIARLSEGNPLFVAQLVEGYRETRSIPDVSSALRTVGDAIAARAARLDAPVRAVAEAAAGIGDVFRADIVADVGGWDQSAVLDAVSALIDRALVREAGSGALEYAFTHALVAAAFYEMTAPDVRAARHRRTARALERGGIDDLAIVLTVARHWKLGGDRSRAGAAYARAAKAAMLVYARDEALDYARQALDLCDAERDRFALLQLVLSCQERSDRVEQWLHDLDEFDAIAQRLGVAERYAALAARERYFAQTGDRQSQGLLVEAMLALAVESESVPWQIEARDAQGMLLVGTGKFVDAIAPFRQALSLAQSSQERRSVSRVRQHLAQALMRAGKTGEAAKELERQRAHCADGASAEERLDLLWAESSLALTTEDAESLARIGGEMLAVGAQLGDLEAVAKAHWLLGWAAQVRRDAAEVRAHYAEACLLFERLRQPQSLAATYVNLGVLELEVGRFEAAIRAFERAATLAERTASQNILGFAVTNSADAHRILGNLETAHAMALRALEIAEPTGDQRLLATVLGTLGSIRCSRGELQAGIASLRESVSIWRAVGSRQSLVEELGHLVEALLAGGAGAEDDACAGELRRLYEQEPDGQKNPARVLWLLARLARLRGDEASAASFEARGRAAAEAAFAALDPDADRAAYAAMPHNRDLLAPTH